MIENFRYSLAIAGALALLGAGTALAQSTNLAPYPHDVVTLITHSSPGGGSDVFLRELVRHLGPQMDVEFVIENVRGGGGARAMSRLANSPADGSVYYAATPSFIFTSLMSRLANSYTDLDPLVTRVPGGIIGRACDAVPDQFDPRRIHTSKDKKLLQR